MRSRFGNPMVNSFIFSLRMIKKGLEYVSIFFPKATFANVIQKVGSLLADNFAFNRFSSIISPSPLIIISSSRLVWPLFSFRLLWTVFHMMVVRWSKLLQMEEISYHTCQENPAFIVILPSIFLMFNSSVTILWCLRSPWNFCCDISYNLQLHEIKQKSRKKWMETTFHGQSVFFILTICILI